MRGAADEAGVEEAAVHGAEAADLGGGEEGGVVDGVEVFGDVPDVLFAGHPVAAVEAREVDGAGGKGAEGFFAFEVVVVVKVAEGEFAEGAVDGFAEAEAGVVGLGDGAPVAVDLKDGEDVVVVADGFEIKEERREAGSAEGGGGEKSAFHAVGVAVAEDEAGREAGGARGLDVVGEIVEKALDVVGRFQGTEGAPFACIETIVRRHHLIMAKTMFDPGLTERYTGRVGKTIRADGQFNVRREGGKLKDAGWFLYFMNLTWPAFLVQMPLIYLGVIGVYACLYLAVGVEELQGAKSAAEAFFFSVQTFTTVGYGHIAPASMVTSSIAAVEAMSGILSLAVATGLIYARFSRPTAHLAFSEKALMAPFQGGRALMFRVANRRPNVLMELEAQVLMMTVGEVEGVLKRRYTQLTLERPNIYFLPLAWTVVHPVDERSPLWGMTAEELREAQAEFLVLVKAFDDTFSQTVHGRYSYTPGEVEWGARFEPAFRVEADGAMVLELEKLSSHAPAALEA